MEDNNKNYFGSIIARVRKEKKMSLKKLASEIGLDDEGKKLVTESYLNRLENSDKDNPSFKMVCLLVDKLSLDIKEVFKSFGYENLLPENENKKYDQIQDIIRISDIKAPLILLDTLVHETKSLSQEEKEIIIEIVGNVFAYAVNGEEMRKVNKDKILQGLDNYRKSRIKMLEEYWTKSILIGNLKFYVSLTENIRLQMDNYYMQYDIVYDEIEKFGKKLFDINGDFLIKCEDPKMAIYCSKSENNIKALFISKNFCEC